MLRKKSLFPQANASPKTKPPPLLKAKIVTPPQAAVFEKFVSPSQKRGRGVDTMNILRGSCMFN